MLIFFWFFYTFKICWCWSCVLLFFLISFYRFFFVFSPCEVAEVWKVVHLRRLIGLSFFMWLFCGLSFDFDWRLAGSGNFTWKFLRKMEFGVQILGCKLREWWGGWVRFFCIFLNDFKAQIFLLPLQLQIFLFCDIKKTFNYKISLS